MVRNFIIFALLLPVLFAEAYALYLNYSPASLFFYRDEVVAEVEGRPITLSFVRSIKDVFELKSEREALDFIIDSFVVLEYARKRKIYVDEEEINFIVEKMFGKPRKELEKDLMKKGILLSEFRDFIKARKISEMIFYQLTGGNFLTERELQTFYNKNREKIQRFFETRFVLFKEYDDEENYDRNYGEEDHSHGEIEFSGEITEQNSDAMCGNLSKFREIGWVRKGELKKDFNDVIFSSPSTGCTSPLEDEGKKIIFFIKEIHRPKFEELKDNLDFRNFYIKEKYREVFERWLAVQRKKLFIKMKNLR